MGYADAALLCSHSSIGLSRSCGTGQLRQAMRSRFSSHNRPRIGSGEPAGLVTSRETVVMVVPKVELCQPTLAELDVDLAIVFTFLRVPESVATLPRDGCVNVHPSLSVRPIEGANGYRALYEGEPRIGRRCTTSPPEFDAGSDSRPGLCRRLLRKWNRSARLAGLRRAATDVLEAGVPRASPRNEGESRIPLAATGAPRFSEDETVLPFAVTTHLFQCRFSALTLAGIQPLVMCWTTNANQCAPSRDSSGLSAASPGPISSTSRRASRTERWCPRARARAAAVLA